MLLHMIFETMDGSKSNATKQPPNPSSNLGIIPLSDNSISSASISEDEISLNKEVSKTSRSSHQGQDVIKSVDIDTSKYEEKTNMVDKHQEVTTASVKPQPNATGPPPPIALDDIMTQSHHLPRLLPFPYRLHHMLNDVEKRGNSHIVSWMPTGRSFNVHKPTEFINAVAPFYFNLTQYKSFKRQLLNYGFKRLESGIFHVGTAFYHPLFLREDPDKCCYIVRERKGKPKGGSSAKRAKATNSPQPDSHEGAAITLSRDKLAQLPTSFGNNVFNALPVVDTTIPNDFELPNHLRAPPNSTTSNLLKNPVRSISGQGGDIELYGASNNAANQLGRNYSTGNKNNNDLMASLLSVGVGRSTASWLFSGAVSLKDLAVVLQSYSGTDNEHTDALLFDKISTSDDCATFREDIISLFSDAVQHG